MQDSEIKKLFSEQTPVRQKEHFKISCERLKNKYPDIKITSCGYGKNNIDGALNINELTALALERDCILPLQKTYKKL